MLAKLSTLGVAAIVSVSLLLAGCAHQAASTQAAAEGPASSAKSGAPAAVVSTVILRIDAGADTNYTDPQGNVWEKDSGFDQEGSTVDRGDIKIENTTMPDLYKTEHYGMALWSHPVPNGKYTLRLHFCETYDGITDIGQRIFTVKVGDKTIKDLDVFQEAGGAKKALVKTLEGVEVKDGTLKIEFVMGTQVPEINGIEVVAEK